MTDHLDRTRIKTAIINERAVIMTALFIYHIILSIIKTL